MSLADDILGFNDAKIEKVSVPEWGEAGEKVYVRLMTGAQRDKWEAQSYFRKQQSEELLFENIKARLVALCACDDKGVAIFSFTQAEALGEKSSTALNRVWEAAMKLNKLSKADVDELVKN